MRVFDRNLVRRRRDRFSAVSDRHGFLFEEIAKRLADRLPDIRRDFPLVLDLGCRGGYLTSALQAARGVETVISSGISFGTAQKNALAVVADEELLPFANGIFDAVIGNLSLHWVNDLPGALVQIRQVLKPDGLFLGGIFGGETLKELRQALMQAELELFGGMSARVSPFVDVQDMGALLQRAGFSLPVVDFDVLKVSYSDIYALMRDLRGMGESNAALHRMRQGGSRRLFGRAAGLYPKDADGRITATFQVVYATGWAPHESQQKPLRPGSAEHRLADALEHSESQRRKT